MSTTVTTSQVSPSAFHPSPSFRPPSQPSPALSHRHIHTIHDRPTSGSSSALPSPPPSISPAVLSVHLGPHTAVLASSPASHPAWTAIHGHVYDLTPFLAQHPGGDVIQLAAGRDATALLESYHPQDAMPRVYAALRNKCPYVGELQGYQQPMGPAFFHSVQSRVADLLSSKRLTYRSYERLAVAESFVTLALFLYATYLSCWEGRLWAAALLGVLTARMGFLMHTGNHCATSGSARVNRWVSAFMNVIGSSHLVWRHEHQVAHHMDPNELHRDNDCAIGNPFIRMHPHLQHHPWQRWQHLTVPFAITFGFVKWYVTDFVFFLRGRVGSVSFAVDDAQWKALLPLKAVWLWIRVLVPLYCFHPLHALALILLPLAIGAHYLENIFIVNHIQHGLVPPCDAHWALKQVLGTSNWASGSVVCNWISGGLNHQVEHHLFPSMNIALYPLISPVVRQVCAEFDVPYYSYPSFFTAYVDMIRYLRAMGQEDFEPSQFRSRLQGQMDPATCAQQRNGRWKGVPVGSKAQPKAKSG